MKIFKIEKNLIREKIVLHFFNIKITLSSKKNKRIKINKKDKEQYIQYVLNQQLDKSHFVPFEEYDCCNDKNSTKIIAMYLPQFHDFPENIQWFGRGFTEWSNTSKTVPQYAGHYQPHIPIDVGYYSLSNTDVYKRQIELAKKYGIYGFCFYYYWYSGAKIMEKPIQAILNDKSLDFPFFLFWANEDWTRLWGGDGSTEILHKQEILEGDTQKFMNDILPYMKDDRYIKILNKPLLIIYDPQKYPHEVYIEFVKQIRNIAKDNGFEDLYILTTSWRVQQSEMNEKDYVKKYMLDGIFEFYPQGMHLICEQKPEKIINPQFRGTCFDISKYIKNKTYLYEYSANLFKGCCPNWDNTPRKCYSHTFVYQNTPADYKSWLKGIINWTQKNKRKEEQFVFVNAWNEWAEGAHLEPDQKYGYAYLQATKEALEETSNLKSN